MVAEIYQHPKQTEETDVLTAKEVIRGQGLPLPAGCSITQRYEIIRGDARDVVAQLPQVHCVVTSPPYWRKRVYGNSETEVGREGEVEEYIEGLVDILTTVPLHRRGSMWINVGDRRSKRGALLDIPHRFVQAMARAGFLLADQVIWAKGATMVDGRTKGGWMPEPAPGRLNGNGFEELFRFVRTSRVSEGWTDACAVAIPRDSVEDIRHVPEELMACHTSIEGRSPANVWLVPMGQTKEKHFGVFPAALIERCIAMTCPVWVNGDGSLVERQTEMVPYIEGRGRDRYLGKRSLVSPDADDEMREMCGRNDTGHSYVPRKPVTLGWTACDPHGQPGVALDPFCGTATTGEAALKLGRSFIGIDLYDRNCELSRQRCEETMQFLAERRLQALRLMR